MRQNGLSKGAWGSIDPQQEGAVPSRNMLAKGLVHRNF